MTVRTKPWKVLIADDDEVIHSITRLVLDDYKLYDQPLAFLTAANAKECRELIKDNPDTALILLDVVMESDDAGLKVVDYIRSELNNRFVRIILRTGQPGQAPEEKVIIKYDINDYKEKTELTSQKLFTAVTAALKSHHDLKTISAQRSSLEQVIRSAMTMHGQKTIEDLGNVLLKELQETLSTAEIETEVELNAIFGERRDGDLIAINAVGDLERKGLSVAVSDKVIQSIDGGEHGLIGGDYIGFCKTQNAPTVFLVIQDADQLNEWQQRMLELFCFSASLVIDNFYLGQLQSAR